MKSYLNFHLQLLTSARDILTSAWRTYFVSLFIVFFPLLFSVLLGIIVPIFISQTIGGLLAVVLTLICVYLSLPLTILGSLMVETAVRTGQDRWSWFEWIRVEGPRILGRSFLFMLVYLIGVVTFSFISALVSTGRLGELSNQVVVWSNYYVGLGVYYTLIIFVRGTIVLIGIWFQTMAIVLPARYFSGDNSFIKAFTHELPQIFSRLVNYFFLIIGFNGLLFVMTVMITGYGVLPGLLLVHYLYVSVFLTESRRLKEESS